MLKNQAFPALKEALDVVQAARPTSPAVHVLQSASSLGILDEILLAVNTLVRRQVGFGSGRGVGGDKDTFPVADVCSHALPSQHILPRDFAAGVVKKREWCGEEASCTC
jgi:hypothetical protein